MKTFATAGAPAYPAEMRTQLWPLCCGISIISGFKAVQNLTGAELVAQIKTTIDDHTPDLQVYKGEQIKPDLTLLTLNSSQMKSEKIMSAIKEAGFVQFATAQPRGSDQGLFFRDKTKSFKLIDSKVA